MNTHAIRSRLRSPLAATGAVTIVAMAAALASAAPSPSCAPLVPGAIKESDAFTPYELTRAVPLEIPLAQFGVATAPPEADVAGDVLAGLALQLTISNGDGLYRYFLDRRLPDDMTLDQFLLAGGIQLDRDPADSIDFAAYLLDELGERAVEVPVGKYTAALTWADPTANGVRSHNLYWSDGQYNYALIAVRAPEELVNLGRSLVCSSP